MKLTSVCLAVLWASACLFWGSERTALAQGELDLRQAFQQLREQAPRPPIQAPAPAVSVKGYYLSQARDGLFRLQSKYCGLMGFFWSPSFGSGWWVTGNVIAMMANYTRLSGDRAFLQVLSHTYENAGMIQPFFRNNFYDDEGWWALGWIAAYDVTGSTDYLFMAQSIFADMSKGWDSTCGGGIWWSKDRKYKNAIANELFLSVGAALASRIGDDKLRAFDLGWAKAEWAWFSRSGMINGQSLINDGLDASCHNNGQETWTYNQGVILGGLAELNKVSPDPKLRAAAESIADAALSKFAGADGVIHESCEPDCSNDGGQFKGAFVRNLMALNDAFPNARYKDALVASANSLLNKAQGPDHEFGQAWSGPYRDWNPGTQCSALDLLVAAASVSP
jgi:predicted alpha-1,6-mannanase (GH76 family)